MKSLFLHFFFTSLLFGQEIPVLEVAPNDPLFSQLKRALPGNELSVDSEIRIKIIPERKKPQSTVKANASSTFLENAATYQKHTGGKLPESIVHAATRAEDQARVRIVALSPSNEAITIRPQPRLWWYQSQDTESRELQFVLSEITSDGSGREIFRRDIPALKLGYNVIDLSNSAVNPDGHRLKPGHTYQWTINHREGSKSTPVFARLKYQQQEEHLKAVLSKPANPDTLALLNREGNWHELLDTYCTLASRMTEEESFARFRDKLLKSAGLLEFVGTDKS